MISRRDFVKAGIGYGAALTAAVGFADPVPAGSKPNFMWLITEDNSKHFMKLFDEHGPETPNIEKLAKEGVKFTHAFSNCPVCSAARSTLATSCYGPRIGTQYHRKIKPVPLPQGLRIFHAYLQDAGYYCSNKKKTDYNFLSDKKAWDSSEDWRGRKPGQQFFHMQSFAVSHEGSLHTKETVEPKPESASVFIPPIHPETDIFRNTYAQYHNQIRKADQDVGNVVSELEKDGLLEDTFIFYFGDHGGVLPGSKGYIYETGIHVPLVIRIPEKWKHLVDLNRGASAEGFVSFIDFGPTLLHLAGVKVPDGVDGRPFMGPGITAEDLNKRDESFSMADRFDEKYDLVRALRKGKFKYMRSYQPFNFDGLHNDYRYKMAAYVEWRDLYHAGKLNKAQSLFFEPRSPEALYDIEKDPYETNNLAGDPACAEKLVELRKRLTGIVKGMPDLSMYPESYLIREAFDNPTAFGQEHKAEIAQLIDIADLSLVPFSEARAGIEKALSSKNPWERYWGLIVCSTHGKSAVCFVDLAKKISGDDPELLVRVRAAEFLGLIGAADPVPVLMDVLAKSEDPAEALLALNTVVLLRDGKPGYKFSIKAEDVKSRGGEIARRLSYLAG